MAAFRYLLGLGGLLLVALAAYGEDAQLPTLSTQAAGYAPAASCQGCHAEEAKVWAQSDHAWALRDANDQNVLGDFAGVRFADSGVAARFFRQGSKFLVNTEGADGKAQDFEIRYTFGHYPLQQYLVAFPGGKLQALTIAWDSRAKEQGGQRWFSLYPGQRFRPEDSLHWTGRYQNWNAMCADCHSTNLQKHYDDQTDTFATTWSEQTVGCQACHGPGQAHVDWAAHYPAGAAGHAWTWGVRRMNQVQITPV
uniref:multiheme c-type cytochrome n=1 Tax=Pseudomonas sp. TaxID=306 RepID=UPI0026320278